VTIMLALAVADGVTDGVLGGDGVPDGVTGGVAVNDGVPDGVCGSSGEDVGVTEGVGVDVADAPIRVPVMLRLSTRRFPPLPPDALQYCHLAGAGTVAAC